MSRCCERWDSASRTSRALLFGECALIGAVGGAFGCALALWQFGSGTTLRAVLESAGYLTVTYDAALEALLPQS